MKRLKYKYKNQCMNNKYLKNVLGRGTELQYSENIICKLFEKYKRWIGYCAL